jgi:hypothetical protein
MYDYAKVSDVTRRILLEFQPDTYAPPHPITAVGPAMERIGYRQMQWPGHGTGENVSYQYLDREYMKAEEYEDYLFDPTGFYLSKYLPRVADGFAGLERLVDLPGMYYLPLVLGLSHALARITAEPARILARILVARCLPAHNATSAPEPHGSARDFGPRHCPTLSCRTAPRRPSGMPRPRARRAWPTSPGTR